MEITTYIKDLLMHYNAVVIPNLGAFEWRYFPAELEAIEQRILPPTHRLVFNLHHQQDPQQRLLHYIAARRSLDLEAAQALLVDFRLRVEEQLLNKEPVAFGNWGSLSMNPQGELSLKLHKTSDFLSPSEGLPTLTCSPILRNKDYLNKTAGLASPKRSSKKGLVLFGTVGALALITAISAIWWWPLIQNEPAQNTGNDSEISIIPAITEQQEQLLELLSAYEDQIRPSFAEVQENESTTADEDLANTTTDESEPNSEPSDNSDEPDEPSANTKDELGESNTTSTTEPGANDYIIVIGVFQEVFNYERNAQLLRDAGYRVQLKKLYTGYTRVAAVVSCSSDQELQEKWAAIRQEFTPKAWLAKH